jgi:hypothetical protein
MAYTTINKSSDFFNTVLYTGNNSSPRTITGVGFQPDMNWSKIRSESNDHWVSDAVRGANKIIRPNGQDDELVNGSSGYLSSFNSDGYVIAAGSGTNDNFNKNSGTMASWNWKAGGGQGSSNTDGSINTTYTSVNTTAGFSISKYTGTGSTATVGHGLGVTPKMIIFKNTSSSVDWRVYHEALGNTHRLCLNDTSASTDDDSAFNDTSPTSTVFTVGGSSSTNAGTMIAYCFAEKTGYSKFGSYVGNNNADGTFVYTGFKPAWIMIKQTSDTNQWFIFDNKRNTFNPETLYLQANTADGDNAFTSLDFTSNGFKFLTSNAAFNNGSYIYMAFAEAPLVGSNNVPCTAR